MPHRRKFYPKDSVLFVTFSAEKGLPLIPNAIINGILEGIMARAQFLYGQELCHYVFMSNHGHLIIRVTDPDKFSDFIGYIKCKSADAVNRLLERKKQTVWCDGFDSPVIVTPETLEDKIKYVYLNPAKARLVDSIEEYPGINSWKTFTKSKTETVKKVRWIRPSTIKKLPTKSSNYGEQILFLNRLRKVNKIDHELVTTPNAWMKTFVKIGKEEAKLINERIIKEVKLAEESYRSEKPSVMGVSKLRSQPLTLKHERKKNSPRTQFLSSDITLRVKLLNWFKEMSNLATQAWQNLRDGIEAILPAGFYGPGRVLHANCFNFMAMCGT
ncbi:MAG: transposase [Deltaproteobacteria bacterium]|nr:transposase [Deltaproteobacteria bacterium]